MKTVGVIAEFNPFHNGHAYLLAEAKRLTGADYAVVVMSGDFVQRGTPAIFDKYTRTKSALLEGADFIFELPVYFATASAEFFAFGAVSLLSAIGVDYICFGSECGQIQALQETAKLLYNETAEFKQLLNSGLKAGYSYPTARAEALKAVNPEAAELLSSPNNVLGIEYCKALLKLAALNRYVPKAVTVKRLGDFNEQSISESPETYSSATAIRSQIEQGLAPDTLISAVPASTLVQYLDYLSTYKLVTADALSQLLNYLLLHNPKEYFLSLPDWNEDFYNRVKEIPFTSSFFEYAEQLKCKSITYTRACRMLLFAVLDIKADILLNAVNQGGAYYARLLGMREESSAALKSLKKSSDLVYITRPAADKKNLSGLALELFEADIRAARVYEMLIDCKDKNEYTRGIVRV